MLLILHKNKKGSLLSPIYKNLQGMFTYTRNDKGTQLNKSNNCLKNEWRNYCITNKGKAAKNKWKNDDSDFLSAFTVYRVGNKKKNIVSWKFFLIILVLIYNDIVHRILFFHGSTSLLEY